MPMCSRDPRTGTRQGRVNSVKNKPKVATMQASGKVGAMMRGATAR